MCIEFVYQIVPFSSGHCSLKFPFKGGEESVFYWGGVKVIVAAVFLFVNDI